MKTSTYYPYRLIIPHKSYVGNCKVLEFSTYSEAKQAFDSAEHAELQTLKTPRPMQPGPPEWTTDENK